MSAKNQLQELMARLYAGEAPPMRYYTKRVGGPNHAPLFESRVAIGGDEYYGAPQTTKKAAEQSAAQNALHNCAQASDHQPAGAQPARAAEKPQPPAHLACPASGPAVVLVDLENVQKLPGLEELEPLARVCIFVARTHALANVAFPPFVCVDRVDSTQKDACDVAMLLAAAEYAAAGAALVIFVSHDHIFGTAVALLRRRWPGLDAFQATSVAECLWKLEN